jgi:NAD(P)-dependent dehydrogenase (short-subunit alcohol dehydrogenase family)
MSGSPHRLGGKIAVVTGGASGIGKAIAEAFCANGATVHLLDVRADAAEATARAIVGPGGPVHAHRCDVTSAGEVDRVFGAIIARGPIDLLVNNAGVAHVGTIEETNESDLDRLFGVNVKGIFHCIRAVIGAMKARHTGVIVNLASIAASAGLANRFAYSLTKGAVLAMTYSVARDYVAHGVRCVSISPARIHTPFVDGFLRDHYPGREAEMFDALSATQPIGRMGTPQEVADLAVYLCSDAASFATGTDYPLDGGFLRLHG